MRTKNELYQEALRTVARRLHNGNRCINGCCHDALSDYRSLKQTAVAVHLVDLYAFLFEQDIQTIL